MVRRGSPDVRELEGDSWARGPLARGIMFDAMRKGICRRGPACEIVLGGLGVL
jgi:hypothetical protein